MKNWNVVLNKILEIKKSAIEKGIDLWAYDATKTTCINYWTEVLGIEEYINIIRPLEINEYRDFVLLRYGNYSDVLGGESEITFNSFWDIYDGFYKECRSVVIDIKNECLVLTPFKKFRNLNESEETSTEKISEMIKKASCVEFSNKLDGSMQSARFYNGEIVMAGSQSLNKNNSWRLQDGYRMLTTDKNYCRMLEENQDKTFIFEYISQKDAHVVKYDKEGLFLIGVRSVVDGTESSYKEVIEYAQRYNILTTEVYDKTLDEIIKELDSKSSDEAEGFVVNVDGFKVKIKYNDYVYMHKMLSAISSINVIIHSIAVNKFDDMISKVPMAYKNRVLKIARLVFEYVRTQNQKIDNIFTMAPKESRKEFMIWVTENVDRELQGYVRNKYLGIEYNVLKTGGRYRMLKEMGIEDYKEFLQ